MEGFLTLAGVIVGVVCLVLARPRDQDSPLGESFKDIGGGRVFDSASGLPSTLECLDGFHVAGSAFGRDDGPWPIDRHHEMSGLFNDFSRSVGDAAWLSDPFALDDPGHAVGIGMGDDFLAHRTCFNPATGLPMISDSEAGSDVGGNPYGFSNDDMSAHHDSFGSGFGSDSLDHLGSDTGWT